jgi:hypothetical protein
LSVRVSVWAGGGVTWPVTDIVAFTVIVDWPVGVMKLPVPLEPHPLRPAMQADNKRNRASADLRTAAFASGPPHRERHIPNPRKNAGKRRQTPSIVAQPRWPGILGIPPKPAELGGSTGAWFVRIVNWIAVVTCGFAGVAAGFAVR